MHKFFDCLLVYCLVLSPLYGLDSYKYPKQDLKIVRGSHSCSLHERFSDCGTDCGHTCDDLNRDRKAISCNASHCTRGCFCEPGFYRDFNLKGRCVAALDCQTQSNASVKCPKNQEYKCGSDCGQTCDDIDKQTKCRDSCLMGCYCEAGYYRESVLNGQCVKGKYCKKKFQKKFNSKKKEFVQWFKQHFPWKD